MLEALRRPRRCGCRHSMPFDSPAALLPTAMRALRRAHHRKPLRALSTHLATIDLVPEGWSGPRGNFLRRPRRRTPS